MPNPFTIALSNKGPNSAAAGSLSEDPTIHPNVPMTTNDRYDRSTGSSFPLAGEAETEEGSTSGAKNEITTIKNAIETAMRAV